MTTQSEFHELLKDCAGYEVIKAAADLHPALEDCPDMECSVCGWRACVFGDPLHFHHDGCPSEYAAENGSSKEQA